MSGDEETGAAGDPPADEAAADDADVEAAIEQEPADPRDESDDAPALAPDADEPVDAPDEPVDAPDEPVDAPDEPVDAPDEPVDASEADDSVDPPEPPTADGSDDGDAPAEADQSDGEGGGTDVGSPSGETIEVEVPANLLRAWEHRASKAKLSVSEYVVRMTEAGRMSVQMQPAGGGDAAAMSVEQLSDEVVEQLRHEDAVSWDQLVDDISKNLEEQLEEALERLQEDDVVRYSGLQGGYRLVEEDP